MNSLKPLKMAVAVYFWLILLEGVFRKWIFPQYSDEIFVIRDPLAILIYLMAMQVQLFPQRPAVLVLGGFVVVALAFALQNNVPLPVTLFGLRTDFLHVPLVFVIGRVLDRDDVLRIGRWTMIAAAPILFLMWLQFKAPPDSWLNVGAHGAEGGQLRGAMGRIRPPGPFSFISGAVFFFALTTSFVLYGWFHRQVFGRYLLWAATAAIVLAVPISISRSLLFYMLVVVLFGLAVVARDLRRLPSYIGPIVAAVALLGFLSDSAMMQTYRTRWEESTGSAPGAFSNSVFSRMADEFTQPFEVAGGTPTFGHGIGMGTVAGARFITGKYAFILAESEMARIVLELGPILGFAFIGWRVWLAFVLVKRSWEDVLGRENTLPWLLTGACLLSVIDGQWGPSTTLGFTVLVAGLALAALNPPVSEMAEHEDLDENPAAD